jgi:hypothetical protein
MNNNQQGNRLQLNFGFGGGDRNNQYQQEVGRAFPTTPSTFPQPVYPNQAGQQEVWGAQQGNGYNGGGGYFMNPYQQAQYQGQQGNLQAPGSQRTNTSRAAVALEARTADKARPTPDAPAPQTTEEATAMEARAAAQGPARAPRCTTKRRPNETPQSTRRT